MTQERKLLPKLDALSLPWPTDWDAVFESGPDPARSLILEIGFGFGQYLRHLSRSYPQAHIIGIEISNMCLVKAEKAVARGELPNVRAVHAYAETALAHLFTPASLDQMHINFPDPWFKSRHAPRRLMKRPTLDTMVSRLKPGSRWYLATDIYDYAEMTAELLAETPGLTSQFDTPWVNELPGRTITKYERKAREAGRDCYYFAYVRNNQAAPDVPVITEAPMPHMVLDLTTDLDAIAARFEPREVRHDEIAVNFKEVYRGDNSLLFDTFVYEPTIEQRVGILLVKERDREYYALRLSNIGSPRPTDGLHVAVRALGEWIAALNPDARVIQDKVRRLD
jgi:tRNA (guanine-N7-)-methyltransferase